MLQWRAPKGFFEKTQGEKPSEHRSCFMVFIMSVTPSTTSHRIFLATMRPKTPFAFFASALIALVLTAIPQSSQAYVLEGPSWASGSTVVFQLGLGNVGHG